MKKYLLITLLVGFCFGQNNATYAEFGGAGYTMTFNYERIFNENFIARIGYGYDKQNRGQESIRFYPFGGGYLIGKENQKIEMCVGVTFINGVLTMNGEVLEPNLKTTFFGFGYRYNIGKNKLLLGLKGYYLFLDRFSAPWAGVSIGTSF